MLTQQLLQDFERYEEPSLRHRFFKFRDLFTLIEFHNNPQSPFKITKMGSSAQDRSIYSFTCGKGPIKVLLWSQMHGDEPTATMTLFDIFNFLSDRNDSYQPIRELIFSKLTLVFIPMLNPDGAEVFQRRNALDIDLNRDYQSLSSPESKILHDFAHQFKPHFAFNLHDQSRYYAVGNTAEPVAMAFLAPAANEERTYTPTRKNAMAVIACIVESLKPIIGAQTAKYADDFAPRCFGDSFQKSGYSTILVESGYVPHDEEKQTVRRYTFASILKGLEAIASESYKTANIETYESIPLNKKERFYDLILSDVLVTYSGKKYVMDIAINIKDKLENTNLHRPVRYFMVADVGDLRCFHAFKHVNGRFMEIVNIEPIAIDQKADFKLLSGKDIVLEFARGFLKSEAIFTTVKV